MATETTNTKVIDFRDAPTLTKKEVKQRKTELRAVEQKLEALLARQRELTVELGLRHEAHDQSEAGRAGSAMFFDEAADIFRDAPVADAALNPMDALAIADAEFDDRFATFVASDEGGDEKARRWLAKR